jgi:hypothetical protein
VLLTAALFNSVYTVSQLKIHEGNHPVDRDFGYVSYTPYEEATMLGRGKPHHTGGDPCARSCEPGSRCCPNECIFGSGNSGGSGLWNKGYMRQGREMGS